MTDMIARKDELDTLMSALRRALAGTPQMVFLTGEAGIGKSFLAEKFINMLQDAAPGVVIAKARCSLISDSHGEPYAPIYDILHALITEGRENPIRKIVHEGIAELAPDWIAVLPVAGDVISATIRTAQWGKRKWDAHRDGMDLESRPLQFVRALEHTSKSAPLLLWIDDLHCADNATVDLLSFLADHLSGARVMILGTYRSTDPGYTVQEHSNGLNRLVSRLARYERCIEIPVPRFTSEHVRLYTEKLGMHLPSEFIARLFAQSGGNPLFVSEYLKLLMKQQLLKFSVEGLVLTRPHVEVRIYDQLETVINERLSLLEADQYWLLSFASIQGERFYPSILTASTERDELKGLEQLSILERVHAIIRELIEEPIDPLLGTEYQFVHALIQQALYNKLSLTIRFSLHLKIAQLLQTRYTDKTAPCALRLAYHFEHGRDIERATRYYVLAANDALAALALDDALARAQDVLRMVAMGKDTRESRRWHIEALLCIAEAQHLKAQYTATLETCESGEALCSKDRLNEPHARFLYWRSLSLFRDGHLGDSVPPLREAISLLGDAPEDRRLLAVLYVRLGAAYRVLTQVQAEEALATAMAIVERDNLADIRAKALVEMAGIAINHKFDYLEARRYAQEAFEIASQHSIVYEQLRALEWLAHASRFLQCGDDAIKFDEQAIQIASKSGLPRAYSNAYHSLAISQREVRQDWRASLAAVHEAVAIADRFEFPVIWGVFTDWFNAAFGLGEWAEARHALKRHRELLEVRPSYPRQWGFYFWREGLISYTEGQYAKAVDQYQAALDAFSGQSLSDRDVNYILPDMGLALLAFGRPVLAGQHIEKSLVYWRDKDSAWHARCLRARANVYLAQGDADCAVADLRLASPLSANYTYHPWPDWAHVRSDLGRALLAVNMPADALEPAREGYLMFKRIGHFLTGEAAYTLNLILDALGRHQEASAYSSEAHMIWKSLGLSPYISTSSTLERN